MYDLLNGPIKEIDLITEGKFDVQGYQNIVKFFNRINQLQAIHQ